MLDSTSSTKRKEMGNTHGILCQGNWKDLSIDGKITDLTELKG
jgi:hypothetical protein